MEKKELRNLKMAEAEKRNKAKKAEILSYLMNYKNSKLGITEEDYEL